MNEIKFIIIQKSNKKHFSLESFLEKGFFFYQQPESMLPAHLTFAVLDK